MVRKKLICEKVFCLIAILCIGGLVTITNASCGKQNDEISCRRKTKIVLVEEQNYDIWENVEGYSELTEEQKGRCEKIIGEWETTDLSLLYREFTKENYNAESDELVGVVLNVDGSNFVGFNGLKLEITDISVKSVNQLIGENFHNEDAFRLGNETLSIGCVSLEEESRYYIEILYGDDGVVYVGYVMYGGFYSTEKRE